MSLSDTVYKVQVNQQGELYEAEFPEVVTYVSKERYEQLLERERQLAELQESLKDEG